MLTRRNIPQPGPANLYRLGTLCLTLSVLGGCASPANNMLALGSHHPLKILISESPSSLNAARLQTVFAPNNKKKLKLTDKPLAQALTHSQHYALSSMTGDLEKQKELSVIHSTPATQSMIDALRGPAPAHTLNQQVANQIHQQTGADAVLRFGITDYGLTPKTWRTGYITFEVVTTLGITAAIASVGGTVAKGAAGAYLAQETVEETAEGYLGFTAVDEVSRPVRIKAELIRLQPVKVVWQDDDTGLSDTHLGRLFRKVSTGERDAQLDQSTDYALQSLVTDLMHKLNGIPESQSPAKLKWQL